MKLRFFISGKFNLTFYGVEITEKIWQNFQLQKRKCLADTPYTFSILFARKLYDIYLSVLKKFLYNFLLSNYPFSYFPF